MASEQERQGNVLVTSCQHSPHQVLHHAGVLVLAAAVIRVQVDTTLANTVVIEEVVQHRHNGVGPFPGLIQQEVNLLRKRFTCNTEQTTLPGTLKVNRSKLQWVRRIVDLLGEIEAVVRLASKTARSMSTMVE